MGLDNGIVATGLTRDDIPCFVKLPFDKDYPPNEIDITYWRKWWGLRGDILDVLHAPYQEDTCHIPVDAEDIPAIIRKMEKYCSKEYWDENADSIWEFEEVIGFSLLQQMLNLKWLHAYMLEHPEVKCYFYDSY